MNKSEERKVIEMVFGDSHRIVIEESERPDFICRVPKVIEFGVEVTDFYLSESVARLRNIPNYSSDLLRFKKYRHKDDKKNIRVDEVIYHFAKSGEKRKIQAIIGEAHTIDDVIARIKAAIESKTDKSAGYSTKVVDLIIHDVEAKASFDGIEKLIRAIGRTEASNSILRTGFREIYLVTRQKLDWVCVPLRANLFVADVLKFQHLFKEHHGAGIHSLTIGDYLIELARHLVNSFVDVEFEFPAENQPRLIFGSVAVSYGDNQQLKIEDISIKSSKGREVADFNDAGDVKLHDFVKTQIDTMFACASVLYPARKPPVKAT